MKLKIILFLILTLSACTTNTNKNPTFYSWNGKISFKTLDPSSKLITVKGKSPSISFNLKITGNIYGQGELGYNKVFEPGEFLPAVFILNKTAFKINHYLTTEFRDISAPVWLTGNGLSIIVNGYQDFGIEMAPAENRFTIYSNRSTLKIILIHGKNTIDAYHKMMEYFSSGFTISAEHQKILKDMLKRIIWTTWAEFKQNITQQKILDFYQEIKAHDFPVGIIEIDDKWQKEWGDTEFDPEKFPHPASLVTDLHSKNVLVTLWVPPFIINNSSNFKKAVLEGYLIKTPSGQPFLIPWWDTLYIFPVSGMIDFTNSSAAKWFGNKLLELTYKYGIDGFKFDAGEATYIPENGKGYLFSGPDNIFTDYYVKWGINHRGFEVRAAYLSQHLFPIVREFDKDSTWDGVNGLKAVVTQALAITLAGYPLVLPDMIGGNAYFQKPSDKLMIRWCQLNTYLPMMQFSLKPWKKWFNPEVEEKCREAAKEHIKIIQEFNIDNYLKEIPLKPIIEPLFFKFPDDKKSYFVDDEFISFNKYLVAPILSPEDKRNIYLPPGRWKEIHTGETFNGPIMLKDYESIDYIPVFTEI